LAARLTIASPLAWGEVLFGALVAATLCFSLWYKLLMRVRAEDPALPAADAGVLAGWLLLGEALSAGLLAGGAIIIGGLAIILWPRKGDALAMAIAQAEAVDPPEV
jgi:O-acetylserine/cysteine efflux transporter